MIDWLRIFNDFSRCFGHSELTLAVRFQIGTMTFVPFVWMLCIECGISNGSYFHPFAKGHGAVSFMRVIESKHWRLNETMCSHSVADAKSQ